MRLNKCPAGHRAGGAFIIITPIPSMLALRSEFEKEGLEFFKKVPRMDQLDLFYGIWSIYRTNLVEMSKVTSCAMCVSLFGC